MKCTTCGAHAVWLEPCLCTECATAATLARVAVEGDDVPDSQEFEPDFAAARNEYTEHVDRVRHGELLEPWQGLYR